MKREYTTSVRETNSYGEAYIYMYTEDLESFSEHENLPIFVAPSGRFVWFNGLQIREMKNL